MNLLPRLLVLWVFCVTCGSARAAEPLPAKGRAEHVVLVVWDGMRPDFLSDEHTPTLAKLARGGVMFTRHHSVYPTSTEVNGVALATGCTPERSGIVANREYRPAIDPLKNVPTEVPEVVAKGDALTGGKYLGVPTLPELVRAAGGRTAVAATKGVGLLWDRKERTDGSVTVAHGHTVPDAALGGLETALGGPFSPDPPKFPNVLQDNWTTRALTDVLWKDGVPTFSLLWLSDPDYSQHASAPGSALALSALRENSDANLARVLAALDAKGVRDRTDVLVVSDHGFSTITESVNVEDLLKKAGFPVHSQLTAPLAKGEVLFVGLGGTMLFYVGGHEPETTARLVEFFQKSAFAGVIFTRKTLPAATTPDQPTPKLAAVAGTFPLEVAQLASPDAPDVVVALRWTDAKNTDGAPGLILGDNNRAAGRGTHATLSPYDLHNLLIAAGPDFKVGFRSETPSGNLDVAPTVASILNLPGAGEMNGRVLREAFLGADPKPPATGKSMESAGRALPGVSWWQQLEFVSVGPVRYLDSSTGGATPKP